MPEQESQEFDGLAAEDAVEADAGVATQEAPVRREAPQEREPKHLPPYKVLLHNDDVSTFEHVVRSITRITPIGQQKAIEVTATADETGVALVLVTHRELAELYQEQFTSVKLTVTVEPTEQ